MSDNNLMFTLDGVGLKQAGELMLCDERTRMVRRKYRSVYKQTLFDICHSLFFGDALRVNPTLVKESPEEFEAKLSEPSLTPDEREDIAGLLLIQKLRAKSGKVGAYSPQHARDPKMVFANPLELNALCETIRFLNTGYLSNPECLQFWHHLVSRDFVKYGTRRPSITGPKTDPNSYTFLKEYHTLDGLDQLVRADVVRTLSEPLMNTVDKEVAAAFVLRVILTHLAIYVNYKYELSRIQESAQVQYIPCQTRSSLGFYISSTVRQGRDCQTIVTPHMMLYLLKRCHDGSPVDFFLRLADFVNDPPEGWPDVQIYGKTLYSRINRGETIKEDELARLRKLVVDAEKPRGLAYMVTGFLKSIIITLGVDPGQGTGIPTPTITLSNGAAECNIDPGKRDYEPELIRHLARVFPETFGDIR